MDIVGKMCIVTDLDTGLCGEWGMVRDFDGSYYYIFVGNDETKCVVLPREAFKVRKVVWE